MDTNRYEIRLNDRTYHITQRTDWQPAYRRATPTAELEHHHDYANYRIDGVRGARGGFQLHRYPDGTYYTTSFEGISHIEGYDQQRYLQVLVESGVIAKAVA